MTREMKFRVWGGYRASIDEITNENMQDKSRMFYQEDDFLEDFLKKVRKYCITWKLMEYTGLKDKNGKEIYEGDLINKGQSMKPFLVKDIRLDTLTLARMIKFKQEHEDGPEFEVIGNKFENPELLK